MKLSRTGCYICSLFNSEPPKLQCVVESENSNPDKKSFVLGVWDEEWGNDNCMWYMWATNIQWRHCMISAVPEKARQRTACSSFWDEMVFQIWNSSRILVQVAQRPGKSENMLVRLWERGVQRLIRPSFWRRCKYTSSLKGMKINYLGKLLRKGLMKENGRNRNTSMVERIVQKRLEIIKMELESALINHL